MAKNLNIIYGYKISRAVKYSTEYNTILKNNPIKNHKDWEKSVFQKIKDFIKENYYLPQDKRCAYCRKRLNLNGYFNHIDHVIPKSHHKRWMFNPKNLVVTCEVCNPLKHSEDTLSGGHSKTKFPKRKSGFLIFNPHYEKWGDCFEIEDGMFIRGKTKRGEKTIDLCRLYQDNFCAQFAEESGISPKSAIRRASIRTTIFPKDSVEYEAAMSLIDAYKREI